MTFLLFHRLLRKHLFFSCHEWLDFFIVENDIVFYQLWFLSDYSLFFHYNLLNYWIWKIWFLRSIWEIIFNENSWLNFVDYCFNWSNFILDWLNLDFFNIRFVFWLLISRTWSPCLCNLFHLNFLLLLIRNWIDTLNNRSNFLLNDG